MAKTTKAMVQRRLSGMHPEAKLKVNDSAIDYDCELVAPPNHHWLEGPHSIVCWSYNMANKSEFWADVLERLESLDDGSPFVPCNCEENPCEGVAEWGQCEWWNPI